MNQCFSCDYWQSAYHNGRENMGTCGNDDLQEKLSLESDVTGMTVEDKQVFTAETFGCIYWERGDNGIVKIKT